MISETIMVPATSQVSITDDAPSSLIREMNLRTYGYAHVVVTHDGDGTGDLTDASIFAKARWTGIVRYMDNGLRTLHCDSPDILFGDNDGKAGSIWTAADTTFDAQFSDYLTGFFSESNGLTAGQILDDNATTFKLHAVNGGTVRDFFMACLRNAPNGPFEYRANPDFSVDTGHRSSLYDSGRVIVTRDPGGRTGSIIGLQAPGLRIESRDIRDWRNHQYVDWKDDHTLLGEDTSTVPAGYRGADGALLEIQDLDSFDPRINRNLRNWSRIYAALLDAQVDADRHASAILNQNNDVREQLVVEVDVDDPHRFMRPGDTIYAYDPLGNIYNLDNGPIQYRGESTFPQAVRFTGWEWPLKRGRHRVFFHRYASGDWQWIELTRWVKWEDGPVRLQIGSRRRSTVHRS